jgi:flagellin
MTTPIRGIGFLQRPLHHTTDAIDDSFRKLAAGKRITRAADDAAGLAIASRLGALAQSLQTGQRNLADGASIARTAEGALASTADSLARMRELAVQAQNGTLNASDRAALQEEYDQLAAEVTRVAEGTSWNGRALLNGDLSGSGAVQLADGQGGSGTKITIAVGDHRAAALGVAGLGVGDAATLGALDQALERVSASRAQLGAVSNRIEASSRSLAGAHESLEAARARIEDADVASQAAELTRQQILQRGQVSVLAHSLRGHGSLVRLLA